MKRLKKRMLANSGFSYVITSVLMICVLLIGVAVFEVVRLYIQAGAVRDKFEDSIISMCVENYSEMYQPIRESHAASYRYNGFRWVNSSKANERYIRAYLSRAMNAGEIMQCEIVSVSFNVEPAHSALQEQSPEVQRLRPFRSRFSAEKLCSCSGIRGGTS